MIKRVAFYCRVSTDGQTVENQTRELEAVAKRHGWEIVETFTDQGVSGAKGRDSRPGFNALHKAIARKEVDMVAAWSVDRLGRSLQDLVAFLGELHGKDIDLNLHQQGIDTTTPAGKMILQIMGVFAEFERTMIQERIHAGLSRAKANGKILGRPKVLTPKQSARIPADTFAGIAIKLRIAADGLRPQYARALEADELNLENALADAERLAGGVL